jgi:hypothetical protein
VDWSGLGGSRNTRDNLAKTKNFYDPQFIVGRATDGKSWSVFCELGYLRPIEIPDFESEAAAQYWVDAISKKWLAKFAAKLGSI